MNGWECAGCAPSVGLVLLQVGLYTYFGALGLLSSSLIEVVQEKRRLNTSEHTLRKLITPQSGKPRVSQAAGMSRNHDVFSWIRINKIATHISVHTTATASYSPWSML